MPIHTWPERSRASAVTRPLDRCRPSSGPGAQVLEAARARVEARDAAAEGAHPQLFVDFEQAHHAGGAERGRYGRDRARRFGLAGSCGSTRLRPPPMVPTQTSPSLPSSMAMTRSSLKLLRTPFTWRNGRHAAGGAIEQVDAAAEGADPQPAELVFGERGDVAIGESFFGAGAEVAERPGARIPLGEAAGLGADPQRAAAVLEQRDDVVVGQRTRLRLRRGGSWRRFRWPNRTRTVRGSGRPTGGPGCR